MATTGLAQEQGRPEPPVVVTQGEGVVRTAPDQARPHLPTLAADPVWQARVYAARSARLLNEHGIRAALAADPVPNVVIEALVQPAEAVAALDSSHRGLLLAAAELLEGAPDLAAAAPRLLDAFLRLSREDRPTSRDARLALLGVLAERQGR